MKTILISLLFMSAYCFAQNDSGSHVYMAVYQGVWQPAEKLDALGIKPVTGLNINYEKNNLFSVFDINLRYGRSANYYSFYYENIDSVIQSNYHVGAFIGGKWGYIANLGIHSRFVPFIGTGIDFIKCVDEADESIVVPTGETTIIIHNDEDDAKYATSYNVQLGFQLQYRFTNNNYLGFEAGYHIIDYTLQNRFQLDGDAYTLCLVFGFCMD